MTWILLKKVLCHNPLDKCDVQGAGCKLHKFERLMNLFVVFNKATKQMVCDSDVIFLLRG